jgi:5-formaminoimidazole-4-carboxamide-1-(beta)-D-ribofuranosyl 5'-monophosphate synthetase
MNVTSEVRKLVGRYDPKNIHVGCIGSHSALEIAYGAIKEGLKTVVVCQEGREKTYTKHFKNLFSHVIVLTSFKDIVKPSVISELQGLNTIFVPNRAFSVYVGYDNIRKYFVLPLFGNRNLLQAEERSADKNEYYLLDKAGLRTPKRFRSPAEIDTLVMVKLPHAKRKVERGFFTVSTPKEFYEKGKALISKGLILEEDLRNATIEEYLIGAYFNLNFFCSPLTGEIEFLGADQRVETNIEGIFRLPSQLSSQIIPTYFPIGHRGVTLRESQLDKIFEMAYQFAKVVKEEYPPGIIGCFSLQGVFDKDLDFVTFDVSFRVPGSPILLTTSPYTLYKYGKQMGAGERLALEIKEAIKQSKLKVIIT